MDAAEFSDYLERCRILVYEELRRIVPEGSLGPALYDRMLDYPRRTAKALRPALCIASCRAFGGGLQAVLQTAAVIELFHNAFLLHDDVEDGSELRRGLPTLHAEFGVPIAVNVGDAMLAIALGPLLDNTRTIGLGKALRVLRLVADMARVTAEGQALELEWTRTRRFDLADADYVSMVERKTAHYSFVTPLLVGALIAGAPPDTVDRLRGFGRDLGIAFQIQDDVLNLTGEYGKELDGDLYEGKHTLILLHLLRSVSEDEREIVAAILAKPRPTAPTAPGEPRQGGGTALAGVRAAVGALTGRLTREEIEYLLLACDAAERALTLSTKTPEDVALLKGLVMKYGSIEYARAIAADWARRAERGLAEIRPHLLASADIEFLDTLVGYVVERTR